MLIQAWLTLGSVGQELAESARPLQAGTDPDWLMAQVCRLLSLPFVGSKIHFCFFPQNLI